MVLGAQGGAMVAAMLQTGYYSHLEVLDLHGSGVGDEGVMAIARVLQQGACPNLDTLHLSGR